YPTAAMVFGPVQWWYSWSGQADDLKRDFVGRLNDGPTGLIDPPQFLVSLLTNERATTTVSLIRREAIIAAGGLEEIFRGLYDEQAFCAKTWSKAAVYVGEACWYKWRKQSDSSFSDAVTRGHYQAARLSFLPWLQQYLSQAGLMTAEL